MIYLDSAATSFQKPVSVRNAMVNAIRSMSSPGRGGYAAAMRASDLCYDCREAVGEMFSCEPENVVFTFNATHGLNIAIGSLVSSGDRVVVSGFEHNAVTRPLFSRGALFSVAESPLFDDKALIERFRILLPGAKACICTHVSNVFGYILPVDDIAQLCRFFGVPLIVDASQSAGCLPVNAAQWHAAFVAMPGHKGLLGPQGTGLLLCNAETNPLLFGGTGSASMCQTMPDVLPDRLEAGTHNIPGIAGLYAGLTYVRRLGTDRICRHEARLRARFAAELNGLPGVETFLADEDDRQSGVLSIRVRGMNCESLAEQLGERGVAVRAGLHCAPLAHNTAGTLETGTVRFSFSPFNTEAEIMRTAKIMREILNKT
ncbi:MAG: aminotransferase class V-fold PLP-dependent enzyme [Oscillospiraceae bacterium]